MRGSRCCVLGTFLPLLMLVPAFPAGTVWSEAALGPEGFVVQASGRSGDGRSLSLEVAHQADRIRSRYVRGEEALEIVRSYHAGGLSLECRGPGGSLRIRLAPVPRLGGAIVDYELPDGSRLRLGVSPDAADRILVGDRSRLRSILSRSPLLRLVRLYRADVEALGSGAPPPTSLLDPGEPDAPAAASGRCGNRCTASCPTVCARECAVDSEACGLCKLGCDVGCEIACREIGPAAP